MKVLILLWVMVVSTFIPSLLPGLKAKEVIDLKQLTGELYGDLLEELNGAHLRIAATHVRVNTFLAKKELGWNI